MANTINSNVTDYHYSPTDNTFRCILYHGISNNGQKTVTATVDGVSATATILFIGG